MKSNVPGNALVLRPASFNDVKFIQEIVAATWPVTYNLIIGEAQVNYMLHLLYSTAALTKQMEEKHFFYLALQDYKAVGFASFSFVELEIAKLQKLYVLPTLQGSGAGKALLNNVEAVSKSMGAKKLWLNVNRKNPAFNFYTHKGFSILKEEDIDIGHGYFMNDFVMEKTL